MTARRFFLALALLVAVLGTPALARTITIVQASRLELRNVTTPDGTVEEYYIITGNPAVVTVDDDEIEASRLEYNKTRRKLRVIGAGTLKSKTETVASRDFEVDLETQGLEGSDVFISTADIDIVGISCQRLPGQLEVQGGYFSPCARCGTAEDAYGFKAANIVLYPGDRLIARDVTVLVGGVPVFYLPIIVVFLNDPSRQPRFEINQNAGADGTTVELDLPFTISDFGQGFTLLRYFERRTPAFGFGMDLTLYDILGGNNKSRVFFLAVPPLAGSTNGLQLAYQFSSSGELRLGSTNDPENRLPPLAFSVLVNRVDSEITDPNDLRGVSGENKRSNFSVKFSLETANYSAELEGRGAVDHRDGPDPSNPGSVATYNAGISRSTQFLPEFRFTARGNLLPRWSVFSVTAWSATAGIVTAPFDPLNTSARRLAGDSPLVSAGKFSLAWALGLDWVPWGDARVNGNASFRGQYYSTQNPPTAENPDGEYERNIVFGANLGFTQNLFQNAVTFSAAYSYSISEGESPFAFDRVATRPPQTILNLGLSARPFPWAALGLGQRIEFTRVRNPLDPLTFSLNLNPAPISGSFTASYDLETMQPVAYSIQLQNTVASGVNFSVSTGYRFSDRFNAAFVPAWNDLNFVVGYRSPDNGRFSLSVALTDNPNNGEIRSWNLSSTLILGAQDAPVTLNLSQTLRPPQYSNLAPSPPQPYARLDGSFSLRFQGYSLTLGQSLDFTPYTYSPSTPTPPSRFSVSLNGSEPLPWSLNFNSAVDLAGFELFQPTLQGSVSSRADRVGSAFDFTLSFLLLLPWRNQADWRFSSATASFGWDVLPGFSVFGSLTYTRALVGGYFKDRFVLNPIGLSLAFAAEGQKRPSIFFSLFLRGTYEFSDDPSAPGLPVFTPPGGGTAFPSELRPVIVIIYDQCCYSLKFTFDTTPQNGVNFSFSVVLPFGQQDILTNSPSDGLRFPILPFIPPIK